jgi:hypothetical protein
MHGGRWRMLLLATSVLVTFPIFLSTKALAQEGPSPVSTRVFTGSDSQNPGVGVVSVEQARLGGREARGSAVPAGAAVGRAQRCSVSQDQPLLVWAGEGLARSGPTTGWLSERQLVPGQQYFRHCSFVDDGNPADADRFIFQPAQTGVGPSAELIARQVYQSLPLALPEPHTAPTVDARQLVGLPIWLWVDGTVWRDFQASASLAGVTVTVVAHPSRVVWEMGDGQTVTCDAGTPWDPDGSAHQSTDCSHYYQFVSDSEPGGQYGASVTAVWSVEWSASTGETGTLPEASRSTDFALDVGERQAVIDYGS